VVAPDVVAPDVARHSEAALLGVSFKLSPEGTAVGQGVWPAGESLEPGHTTAWATITRSPSKVAAGPACRR
jgi:hypothetical protein